MMRAHRQRHPHWGQRDEKQNLLGERIARRESRKLVGGREGAETGKGKDEEMG